MAIETGPPPVGTTIDEQGRVVSPTVVRDDKLLPIGRVLPTELQLRDLTSTQLHEIMALYKIDMPWLDYVEDTKKYLSRISKIPPNSDQFERELERLLDVQTKRGALGMARETNRRTGWVEAAQGDPEGTLYIRITDATSSTCDACFELAGAIGPLSFHEGIGLPGPNSCLGGAYCNCQLVPVEFE